MDVMCIDILRDLYAMACCNPGTDILCFNCESLDKTN